MSVATGSRRTKHAQSFVMTGPHSNKPVVCLLVVSDAVVILTEIVLNSQKTGSRASFAMPIYYVILCMFLSYFLYLVYISVCCV